MNKDLPSIKDIDAIIKAASFEDYPSLIEMLKADGRPSVEKRLGKTVAAYEALKKEYSRIEKIRMFEETMHHKGIKLIGGIDEVGRGCLFGPVVSACVVMKPDSRILYVNDSKKLTPKKRRELCEAIKKEALAIGVGVIDNGTIDSVNILRATKMAMQEAVASLEITPELLIIDALEIESEIPQRHFIMGDENFYSIACASIVAKVTRDAMMVSLGEKDEYKKYFISENKGYGTAGHIEALREFGPSDLHRRSFIGKFVSSKPRASLGKIYEQKAKELLISKGLEFITSNYKRSGGEIDLVFYDPSSQEYVFCEVRYRKEGGFQSALESISREKTERVKKCALAYMVEKNLFCKARFDVVAFDGNSNVQHIVDAFG